MKLLFKSPVGVKTDGKHFYYIYSNQMQITMNYYRLELTYAKNSYLTNGCLNKYLDVIKMGMN